MVLNQKLAKELEQSRSKITKNAEEIEEYRMLNLK